MTPLVLSHADQRRLAATAEALLSPLAYADADQWRRAVCERVCELLGADMVIHLLPGDGGVNLFADGHEPGIADYPNWIGPVASAFDMFTRLRTLGAATRPMLYGDLDAFYRSAYWHEYCVPYRAFDSLTMSVAVGPEPTLAHHTQLIVNKDSPHKPRLGDPEVGMGRLLLPALQTGALAWLRLAHARHAFAAMVDTFAVGTLVYDADGRELHRNPPAVRLLASDLVARGLATLAGQMAKALAQPSADTRPFGPASVPTTARSGRFVLRATRLWADVAGREGIVLVTVEGPGTPRGERLPDPGALQARFGLTPQQARVARLLAERRTNAEIAEALFVSVHTVRRHVEQVLAKLGVPRREEVDAAVRGGGEV